MPITNISGSFQPPGPATSTILSWLKDVQSKILFILFRNHQCQQNFASDCSTVGFLYNWAFERATYKEATHRSTQCFCQSYSGPRTCAYNHLPTFPNCHSNNHQISADLLPSQQRSGHQCHSIQNSQGSLRRFYFQHLHKS